MVVLLQTKANNYHRMRQIITAEWKRKCEKKKNALFPFALVFFLFHTHTRSHQNQKLFGCTLRWLSTWRDNYNVSKWVFVMALSLRTQQKLHIAKNEWRKKNASSHCRLTSVQTCWASQNKRVQSGSVYETKQEVHCGRESIQADVITFLLTSRSRSFDICCGMV